MHSFAAASLIWGISTLLWLQMVITEVLHYYGHVIAKSITVKQSAVPNLSCSLSPRIVFHFFVHVTQQLVLWRVAYCCLPLSIEDAWCLYREHLVVPNSTKLIQLIQLRDLPQSFLRWANVRADLNMLTQMLVKVC
jgi:hypothetical protein